MNKKIWLSSPNMGGKEQVYVKEAFETNWIAPLGPHVNNFEKDICNYTGAKHCAALSSGTSAIHLALILLGVKSGDEVLCSTFTFSATVNPIIYQGATPIFIDSEDETWNMSPILLEEAIIDRIKLGKKPKAILLVHLYGIAAKMEEITEIASKYDIPLIEDAAEALGSTYKGKALGTFGVMGVFSFNGNKIITTSGGGALVSDDEDLIKEARFLATQARDNAPHYQHSQIGYNYRMSNICAGIGRGQMEVLNERVAQKRKIRTFYKDLFENIEGINILEEDKNISFSNAWLTCILIDKVKMGFDREDLRLELEKDNIEARPLWKPMHLQPIFEKYPAYTDETSERLFDIGLCLPSDSNIDKEDIRRIEKSIKNKLV
ncbi:aminotransferase class I/II-fold pyridoxal phosphate-dependent enzyme [Flammeovirga sp. SJP92]|uniref:aminotransferase class I/II-fold pyridoxal phosphate-dependent enzyme n=1 Tax=Flammeovirga sp. SJP92 TaxID=1775430 RepID=UPI0007915D35|nr:aminotransferase class I/II-fold pyridoxal phosphate-dependent enzyme [Flammeovirga sp. SJP92]KXX68566.1 pyridoxal phosphate-dependent aminotransferase [Flammeovirga sp. SJP92]